MNAVRWQQIESLFYAALEREPSERADFLKKRCGADSELFVQVDSLLSTQELPDDFLNEPYFSLGLQILDKSHNTLQTDQKFGNYQILSLLGRGGMGEVYLARDEKLNRKVAVKLLTEFLTENADWRERFGREAQTAAAISHPNIAHIYEVGENDGLPYIAMEYVAGKTLRAYLIENCPLSETEAVKIAAQIASALSEAHKTHIVHRDIKPENVVLRDDGYAKVLDFGVAKPGENALEKAEENGLIVGTPRYMPPEQIRGEEVDERADVWSLGVVLYEMLNGKTPFQGEDRRTVFEQILSEKPFEFSRSETAISKPVQKILRRALAKNAEKRYLSAAEMLSDLQIISDRKSKKTTRKRLLSLAAFLLISMFGAVFYFINREQKQNFSNAPPSFTTSTLTENGRTLCAAIAPDTSRFAYAIEENGRQSIQVKSFDSDTPVQIVPPSAENDFGGACLAFSPDGNQIYYGVYENESLDGKLYRVSLNGGESEFLLDEIDSPVSFSPDGKQMVYLVVKESEEKLIIADTDGTNRKTIISRNRPQLLSHDGHPSWSPDGRYIAFADGTNTGKRQMFVSLYDTQNGTERNLTNEPFYDINQIGWMADGNSLIAITRQDGENLRRLYRVGFPNGETVRLTDDFYDYAGISFARTENKFITVAAEDEAQIWTFDTKTNQTQQVSYGKNDSQGLAWSGGGQIVFGSHINNSWDLMMMNADGSNLRQLTNDAAFDTDPSASNDGKFIVFTSNRAGIYNLWRMNLETNEMMRLTNGTGEYYPQISPDNNWAVYHRTSPGESIAVWKISTAGGAPVQISTKPTTRADISPDGKLIASTYRESSESAFSIGIYDFDGGKNLKLLKPLSGARLFIPLRWSPDGKAVVYVVSKDGVDNLWNQPIDEKNAPRQLTNFTSNRIYGFDFAPDNSKIAVARGTRKSSAVMFEITE
ncbi:hypothetical protein BH20ACI1_BH20ACI1_16610 [soil metagenome]